VVVVVVVVVVIVLVVVAVVVGVAVVVILDAVGHHYHSDSSPLFPIFGLFLKGINDEAGFGGAPLPVGGGGRALYDQGQ